MKNIDQVLQKSKAGKGQRLLNFIVDMLFFIFLSVLLGLLLGVFSVLLDLDIDFLDDVDEFNSFKERLIMTVLIVIYYFAFEAITKGRSLGKYLTGTMVVDELGKTPSVGRFFKRNLCRCIPFDSLSFLGNRGWHDSVSGTVVVDKKSFEKEIEYNQLLQEKDPFATIEFENK